MKKTLLATLAALMTLQAGPVLAENYEVSLTRKGALCPFQWKLTQQQTV